eukprot:4645110-Prymnesium_polylepis.1
MGIGSGAPSEGASKDTHTNCATHTRAIYHPLRRAGSKRSMQNVKTICAPLFVSTHTSAVCAPP